MGYYESLGLGNLFKDDVVNLKTRYLDSATLLEDLNITSKWNQISYPFDDEDLVNIIRSHNKLTKAIYEQIFEQLRKNEKLFIESIGGRGEVRKELYLPHVGQFAVLDAFIRKGEESFTHRHKAITEVYRIEYGEVEFIDSNGKNHLCEGDLIIFDRNIPHTFSTTGEYTVISVIKDFRRSIDSLAEMKMLVEMDWYSSSYRVPRKDILILREKRKLYSKIIKEIREKMNVQFADMKNSYNILV